MRLDASRSLAEQHMNPISPYLAGHGDPGGYAVLDRALTRWLAAQTGDRNQRIGYARGRKFHLAVPISEAEALERDKRSRKRRQARALNVSVEVVDAVRAKRESARLAKLKADNAQRIVDRMAALPEHLIEAFDLKTHFLKSNLARAEWVATLEPEAQAVMIERRRLSHKRFYATKNKHDTINEKTETLITSQTQTVRAI